MNKLTIKTPGEIEIMAQGGSRLAVIRDQLARAVRVGTTTAELDTMADELIKSAGGKPSFKMVPGYKWATCINVNDVVVHGTPGKYKLKTGDKVGIDVGMYYKGFHSDTSVTVGGPKRFLDVGRKGLAAAIKQAWPGKRVMDISRAMQTMAEASGFSMVRALTGHGIGRYLHEEPAIPCFVMGKYNRSVELKEGMVLAIEIMYNEGVGDVIYQNDDGWTISTADGKISGLFEETVAVTKTGPVILTRA